MANDATAFEQVWEALDELQVPLMTRLALQHPLRAGNVLGRVARRAGETALVVYSRKGSWLQVELARGAESLVVALLTELRGAAEGIAWDDDAGEVHVSAEALSAAGFPRVMREEFLQDLAKVPLTPPEIDGVEVGPLDDGLVAPARELYARTHVVDLATAFYTTWPEPPSLETCRAAFDGLLNGEHGRLLPEATFAARVGAELVGFVVCVAGANAGEGVLLDLGVAGAAQGRGISRLLVRCAQRALKAAGFSRMRFFTTGGNQQVHKLFTAGEIVETAVFHARLWRREAHGV